MSKKPDPEEERSLVEKAKALGYRVVKTGQFVKTSITVHEDTLLIFRQVVEELDYKVQDAVTEAFDQWCQAKQPELRELASRRQASRTPRKD